MHTEQAEMLSGQNEKRTLSKSKRKIIAYWFAALALGGSVLLPSSASASTTETKITHSQPSGKKPKHHAKSKLEIPSTVGTPVRNLCNVQALADYLKSVLNPAGSPPNCKDTSSVVYAWADGVGSWKETSISTVSGQTVSNTTIVITAIVPNNESRSSGFFPVDHNVWQHDLRNVSSSKFEKIIKIFSGKEEAIIFKGAIAPNEPYSSYEEALEIKRGDYVVYDVVDHEGGPIKKFPLSDEEKLIAIMLKDGFTH